MAFTPFTKPTDTIQSLSDRPNQTDGLTAAQLKIKFDQGMIDTKDYITGLLAELASTTSTSGASNIGNKTITGIVGNDLQTTLEALKVLIDLKSNLTDVYSKTNLDSGQLDNRYYTETELINGALDGLYATLSNTYTKSQVDAIVAGVILGQIGDGSITDVKLSNAVGNIKERLSSSLADNAKDYVRSPAWGPASGAVNVYTFNAMPATALVDGMAVYLDNVIAANTGASTFNWSGLGAKAIVDSKGVALTAGKIPLNCIVGLRYNASASNFQLLGEGGDVLTGNLVAGDLLSGKTGYSSDPLAKITGTLALTATAIASDVLSGKTFYNTDAKTKGTGTFVESLSVASENLIISADTQRSTNLTTPQKVKEIQIKIKGTYRVKFTLEGNSPGVNHFGRIYKNGVGVGIIRSIDSTIVTYTEDLTFNANDLVQLYIYTNRVDVNALASNFRIYSAILPIVTLN